MDIIYFLRSEYLQEEKHLFTLISTEAVGKNMHATIPKGNMGYDQYRGGRGWSYFPYILKAISKGLACGFVY